MCKADTSVGEVCLIHSCGMMSLAGQHLLVTLKINGWLGHFGGQLRVKHIAMSLELCVGQTK